MMLEISAIYEEIVTPFRQAIIIEKSFKKMLEYRQKSVRIRVVERHFISAHSGRSYDPVIPLVYWLPGFCLQQTINSFCKEE